MNHVNNEKDVDDLMSAIAKAVRERKPHVVVEKKVRGQAIFALFK